MSDSQRIRERRAMFVAAAVALGACKRTGSDERAPPAPCLTVAPPGYSAPNAAELFSVVVHVFGDDHQPVDGARVLRYGVLLGTTGTSGRTSIELRGARSEVAELVVECPEGFET